jgi:hypothetical protein
MSAMHFVLQLVRWKRTGDFDCLVGRLSDFVELVQVQGAVVLVSFDAIVYGVVDVNIDTQRTGMRV